MRTKGNHPGDGGNSTLKHPNGGMSFALSKADDRFELTGCVEELSAQLGCVRAVVSCPHLAGTLDRIRRTLMCVCDAVAAPQDRRYAIPAEEADALEAEMARMAPLLAKADDAATDRIPAGQSTFASAVDVASAVARRAERRYIAAGRRYTLGESGRVYLNRLSSFLRMLVRYADELDRRGKLSEIAKTEEVSVGTNAVIAEVVRQIGEDRLMNLRKATAVIEAIERHAAAQGKRAVIAVCNAEGRPVAVHVMDGAYLVSYEVALKKAYTAVAVKMPTSELGRLVQPGQTFFGLQRLDSLITFGGGIPLFVGERLVGGIGVSGGTGEEDHALCTYGADVFARL